MIDIPKDYNNPWIRHRSEFAEDFVQNIRNIEEDEERLLEIARSVQFADIRRKKWWVTGERISILDDKWDVKMTARVSNTTNIAPEVDDKIVGQLRVISIWTKWNNIDDILHLLKDINDSSKDGNIEK